MFKNKSQSNKIQKCRVKFKSVHQKFLNIYYNG